MSIIKGTAPDGMHYTCVQPDANTLETVQELKTKKCTNIHNPETGKKYE